MPINLTSSTDIVAHSVWVAKGNVLLNLLELIQSLTGVPPSTLDNLEKIAIAIDNDPLYAQAIIGRLSEKADSANTYSKTEVDNTITSLIGDTTLNTLKKLADAIALKQVNLSTGPVTNNSTPMMNLPKNTG